MLQRSTHVLLCTWGKVHICETQRGWNTSHHFLHEFTLWPQLSTQWAGTEGCVRAWLINYRLLGNVLLGSKQWLHRWHLSRHLPLLRLKQAPRNCMATCTVNGSLRETEIKHTFGSDARFILYGFIFPPSDERGDQSLVSDLQNRGRTRTIT